MAGLRRAVAAAAAIPLAVVTLAGCGGDAGAHDAQADRAYINRVNVAVKRFAREAQRLPAGFEADTLHTYSATLDRTADNLRAIRPPAPVAALHRQLAGDVSSYADAIDAAASAPLSEDPDKVVAAQQDLLDATRTANREVNRTLRAIGRKLAADQS